MAARREQAMAGWRGGAPRRAEETQAREAMCALAHDIWARGLGAAGDGNLSVRLPGGAILTTPAGCHKGRLKPTDLVVVDASGAVTDAAPDRRPSSELGLHLAAYRARADVGAVIHAHPPTAVALELAGVALSDAYVSEIVFACGLPATAPYTTPTSGEVGATLGAYLRCHDVVLMPRHGVVCVGADLDQAFVRLDALEHSARITWMAHAIGQPTPLPAGEVDTLFRTAGRTRPGPSCPPLEPGGGPAIADEALVAAVLARLRGGGP